jgi:hypothetical protein
MKYFFDTEFNEGDKKLDLISIGIISEDDRTFYAEVPINNISDNFNPFVKKNILPLLKYYNTRTKIPYYNNDLKNMEIYADEKFIKDKLLEFIDKSPEFWAYYADYDWVIFCWIFGQMVDLPEHFPKFCNDIKQLAEELNNPKIADPEGEHNALIDAKWNKKYYEHLINIKNNKQKILFYKESYL